MTVERCEATDDDEAYENERAGDEESSVDEDMTSGQTEAMEGDDDADDDE